MNRAEKRRQKKLTKKAARNAKPVQSAGPSPEQQTLTIQQSLDLAVQHHTAGDLPKAEGIYQQILQADPNQFAALHLLGVIAYQVGKHDTAVDLITKAVAIKPDLAEAHNNLGNVFKELRKLDEAVASYQKALAIKPDYAEAHYNLGNAFKELGKLDEAVASYHKAIAIKPDYAEAHNNLGNVLKDLGRLDEAVASYRKALAIKPDYDEAHNNLGNVHKELGKLDEAVASYGKALAIKPDYAEAHNNLGNALQELGKLDEAVASYGKALAIKPDLAEAHNNLGNVFKELRKLDEAVASYQKALAIKPDYAEAHYNLGNAFKELGKLDEAVASYHKAIAIKPDYAEAHNNLGNVLKDLGRLDEAVASYRKALAIKPDYPGARHTLNSLLGNTTDIPPREYVEGLFDSYAERFETSLVTDLAYMTPSLLKEAFLDHVPLEGRDRIYKVIDLGCGTGLVGVEFKDISGTLTGIDLSKNMVRKAEEKDIYDELYVDDIIDRLEALDSKFDLFISADVLVYIGNLCPLFRCVKRHSRENSLFIFSTEHTDTGDFILQKTGRYAHSKDYILSVATESGLQLDYFTKSNLRREKTNWIIGGIYILRCV